MYTPGPWRLGTSCDGFVTVTDGTKTICTVGAADIFPGIEEDARLIAGAPELLVALKAMCEEWRRHGCCDSRGVESKAEQTIAKAEGRV